MSLGIQSKLSFFDNTGVITHGFSSNIISILADNCERMFSVSDLMNCGLISSMKLAIVVLEVFNEVFEDIEISESLYELVYSSASVFEEVLAVTQPSVDDTDNECDFF